MIRPRPASVAPRSRLRLLACALGLAFLVVAGQLANLQILSGERLAALSDRNRLRLRPIAAPRGILFDRTGLPLVDNRPAFTLVAVPRDVPDLGALVERLARLLAVPESELRDRLARVSSDSPWPIRLSRGLTLEESAAIMELLGRAESLLHGAFEPDGFNIGMNLGRVAGAGVPGHLHLHVVPRWNGDTNFMPVTGETKVMVEGLAETYARLARVLAEGASPGGDAK